MHDFDQKRDVSMKIKHATKSNLILADRGEFPEYIGARNVVEFSRYRKSKFILDNVISYRYVRV